MFKRIYLKCIHAMHAAHLLNSFPTHQNYWQRILGLIFLGIFSRLLPHPPNFTAMNSIALFGICSLGNLGSSLITVFATLFFSDLLLGFHSSMLFVYCSYALITLLGYALKTKRTPLRTTFLLTLSSFLFFIITNFGIWLLGSLYPKTLAGLILCYFAALPFLLNSLLSTFLYGALLFGWLAYTHHNRYKYLNASC